MFNKFYGINTQVISLKIYEVVDHEQVEKDFKKSNKTSWYRFMHKHHNVVMVCDVTILWNLLSCFQIAKRSKKKLKLSLKTE